MKWVIFQYSFILIFSRILDKAFNCGPELQRRANSYDSEGDSLIHSPLNKEDTLLQGLMASRLDMPRPHRAAADPVGPCYKSSWGAAWGSRQHCTCPAQREGGGRGQPCFQSSA